MDAPLFIHSILADKLHVLCPSIRQWVTRQKETYALHSRAGTMAFREDTLNAAIMRCGRMGKATRKWMGGTGEEHGWILAHGDLGENQRKDIDTLLHRLMRLEPVCLPSPWVVASRPRYTEYNDTRINTVYFATHDSGTRESFRRVLHENKVSARCISNGCLGLVVDEKDVLPTLEAMERETPPPAWNLNFNYAHGRILESLATDGGNGVSIPKRAGVCENASAVMKHFHVKSHPKPPARFGSGITNRSEHQYTIKYPNGVWCVESGRLSDFAPLFSRIPPDILFFITPRINGMHGEEAGQAARHILDDDPVARYAASKTIDFFEWVWLLGGDYAGTSTLLFGSADNRPFHSLMKYIPTESWVAPL